MYTAQTDNLIMSHNLPAGLPKTMIGGSNKNGDQIHIQLTEFRPHPSAVHQRHQQQMWNGLSNDGRTVVELVWPFMYTTQVILKSCGEMHEFGLKIGLNCLELENFFARRFEIEQFLRWFTLNGVNHHTFNAVCCRMFLDTQHCQFSWSDDTLAMYAPQSVVMPKMSVQ